MSWFDRRERIHFLHIGKNAGTQIGLLIEQINAIDRRHRIERHGHDVRLRDLPPGERYFFSIREPVSRFVSAFYSRKRKGQPRRYSEWSRFEARAFEAFEHANDLAEALFGEGDKGALAMAAIKSISHTSMEQIAWFDRAGFFLEVRPPICILRQEQLAQDVGQLRSALELAAPLTLSADERESHATDYSEVPPLTDGARANLARWYAQDLEFHRRCLDWIARSNAR